MIYAEGFWQKMIRFGLALLILLVAPVCAEAACDTIMQMSRTGEISKLILEKMDAHPVETRAISAENQVFFMVNAPTEETCAGLDLLLERAKAL